MPTLPAHPNLDQLRHQAKDLLRAANSGDGQALAQIRLVSDQVTLASAQLAVARAYGFASWPKLKAEVEARTLDLAEKVDAFCKASMSDGSARAARMLAATPAIAGHSFATAVILGDAARVSEELRRDPGLATRRDPRSGWTPLHAVSGSRWHQFEPARAGGLLAVARLLIDAGGDPAAKTGWRRNELVAARLRGCECEQRRQQPSRRGAAARARCDAGRPRPLPRRLRARPSSAAAAAARTRAGRARDRRNGARCPNQQRRRRGSAVTAAGRS